MAENFLLASQAHHTSDVRGVSPLPTVDGAFIASSRDKSAGVWLTSPSGMCEPMNLFSFHEHFVSNAVYHPALDVADNTPCVVTVSHDKHVLACSLETGQLEAVFDGHDGAVSCVCVTPAGDIITGSWDSTAIIWRKGESVMRLRGHTNSVLCVCVLQDGEILTGSGDKTVCRWSPTGAKLQTYKSHTDSVQAVCGVPDIGFLSAGNDTRILLNAIDGTILSNMLGHEGFVYSLALLPSGEVASVSEDRTLRVWRNSDCVQTVYHPTTVWSVCALPNGNLVTGCADGFARVWTRDPKCAAPASVVDSFQVSVSAAQISTKTMSSQLDPSRIEPREALKTPGNTEGQMRFVKAEYGTGIEVYTWSAFEKSWTKIGDVADSADGGAPAAPTKTTYKGKEYDYVFDIDFNGTQSLKLPYNDGDNPWTAAQNFITDNSHLGVSQLDKEAIIKWILQHTKAGQSAATSQPPSMAPPPKNTPPPTSSSTHKIFTTTNFEGISKKLRELEAPSFQPLVNALTESKEMSPETTEVFENLLMNLKPGDRYPALDLFRHAALYTRNDDFLNRFAPRVVTLMNRTAAPNEELVCLRAAANMISTGPGARHVVALLASPITLEEVYGPVRKSPKAPNREALAAVIYNGCRWCTTTGSTDPNATAIAANIVSFLGEILLHEQETATKTTALLSLKMLLTSPVTKGAALERASIALTYGCVHTNTLYGDPDLIALATEVLSFLPKPIL